MHVLVASPISIQEKISYRDCNFAEMSISEAVFCK